MAATAAKDVETRHTADNAATSHPRTPPEVLDYASSVRDENAPISLIRARQGSGNACWIPAEEPARIEEVLKSIVLNETGVSVRRWAPLPGPLAREIAEARQLYWDSIATIRQDWIKGGSVVDDAIARQLSEARLAFRNSIRSRYPTTGIAAEVADAARGGYAGYVAKIVQSREAKLAAGDASGAIASVFRSNAAADRLAIVSKTMAPALKALSFGSTIVTAAEIPYRLYELDIATTREEQDRALQNLSNATASAAIVAVCIVLGVSTAGLGLLTCGVAPVAAGFYAGDAALYVRKLIK
ncbi:hypothetical protein [Sphingomonas sp.]|jgi:hypothetical protein|uniref:hypothetical protein n=1 Tax=Sphingomonas sp. TaxID=28214 RepID=UPI002DEAEB27|nr:hypothetical protein [Sphingomonas sp.]